MTFDPRFPPTSNSLNRLRLEAAALPDAVRGKTGYELLSTTALEALIQSYTSETAVFYEQVARKANWAIEIARTLGDRLGWLLFVLIHNDRYTWQANPEKPPAYWTYWSGVRSVYLGGGLVRGQAGEIIAAQAQATLHRFANDPDSRVTQAAYPQYLPLLGAARIVQAGQRASVLDFGGSSVKRAIAHYTNHAFSRLQIREALPSDFPTRADDARLIFERMVDILVQAYAEADSPMIPVSIAAYVNERGQPALAQGGIYMQLAQLTTDVPTAFSQAVSERLGTPVEVKLVHDGTAAALYYAPIDHAAVIMMGTALGSGYPVGRTALSLCPVSPTLIVE